MKPGIDGSGKQRGASLLAVIFLLVVVAFFGTVVVSLVATQSFTSVNEMQSTQALYVAEGGLERAVSYFLGPALAGRVACAGLPGAATPLNPGQFQLNVEAGSPFYSTTATAISAGGVATGDTVIPVVSTVNYAPFGRLMIDRELIDYTGTTATSFTGALRGRDGTLAAPHIAGTRVGQNQCTVTSAGGVMDLSAGARGRRVQRAGVQLQEAWVVGDVNAAGRATLLRWNGVSWTDASAALLPITANQRLNAVAMLSYADGIAVGNTGGGGGACTNNARIFGWNGTSWTCFASTTTTNMNAVAMLSSRSGWAAGNRQGNNFVLMRWDNPPGVWTPVTVNGSNPTRADLNGISLLDMNGDGVVDDGWAVGNRRGGNFTFLRYIAGSWIYSGQPDGSNRDRDLNAVYMMSSKSWAVGRGGVILSCDPLAVTTPYWVIDAAPGAVTANDLNGVTCPDSATCWAVGKGGVLLRWMGAGWSVFAAPGTVTGNHLNGVACASALDCWAVGDAGTILHWDGNAWSVHPQSGVVAIQNLRGIHIIGPRARPQAAWREVVN